MHNNNKLQSIYHQLRDRRALLLFNVYGNSALLVLNEMSLNIDSALLALNGQYVDWIVVV